MLNIFRIIKIKILKNEDNNESSTSTANIFLPMKKSVFLHPLMEMNTKL